MAIAGATTVDQLDPDELDLSDDEISHAAKQAAEAVRRMSAMWSAARTPDGAVLSMIRKFVRRHHIEAPARGGLASTISRLCDAVWWRRALRKRFRALELAAIHAGTVHRHASPYVSDRAMRQAQRDRRRVAELLASLDAVNQTTGEVYPLAELVKQSLADPSNRRKALMARIKGVEGHSKTKGHAAMLLTITCPSRMHARHVSGAKNDRYDGSSPRAAQAHLNQVWRRAMRKLLHGGISPYGLRVVEPHHDACPHWHVLAFVPVEQAAQLVATLRAYALSESPDEPGAAEHRFTVVHIDPAVGSAVGYVAKYVSKSIDGLGVLDDEESDCSGADASLRTVTWARRWGIRQFQFFGLPPITPTRELYRLDRLDAPSAGLQAAHQACKANDYGAWLHACECHGLRFKVTYTSRPSCRYPDELSHRITGLTAQADDLEAALQLVTRTDEWRIEPRPKGLTAEPLVLPRTRFNNCAPIDFNDIFATATATATATDGMAGEFEGGWRDWADEVSCTGHRYPVQDVPIGDRASVKHSQAPARCKRPDSKRP